MTEKIIILDFGSQYTQLIARSVREANVYCEIQPFHKPVNMDASVKGIILTGSPFSVKGEHAPMVDVAALNEKVPVLGVCYGAQLTAKIFGGRVEKSEKREYGRAHLTIRQDDILFKNISEKSQVWMSHGDTILELPTGFKLLATTESIPVAAFKKVKSETENGKSQTSDIIHHTSDINHPLYGLQFHPEVYHSTEGKTIISNFLHEICGCAADWTPAHFVTETIAALKAKIGNKKVIMALSGGVDSTVPAPLISRAIGKNLFGIFVDNGVLRKGEFEQVIETYKLLDLNVKGVDAKDQFYTKLAGKSDPEEKRKVIG